MAAETVVVDPGGPRRLAFHVVGPPSGLTVLLLPGGGQTRHSWSATAERLAAAGSRAVCLDLPGHGDSDWRPDGRYGPQFLADDLRVAIARLSPAHAPVLVGASLGGLGCLLAAGEAPRAPHAGLVLVDITPRPERAGTARIAEFMRAHPEGFADLGEAADAVAAYLPERRRPPSPEGLRRNLRQGEDGRWRWHYDPDLVSGRRRGLSKTTQDRLVAAAGRLERPTMLVRGLRSDVVSDRSVDEFVDAVPHARVVDVRRAGHMVAGDANDVFADAVVAFLDDLPSRRGPGTAIS